MKRSRQHSRIILGFAALVLLLVGIARSYSVSVSAQGARILGPAFDPRVLAAALPEAPFDLRFFTGAVKTGPDGKIITGPGFTGQRRLVGAEAAGERAGMQRFTKIMFAVGYFDGRPNPGDRIDPNNPQVDSGGQHWPFVKQPFRSWPNSVAITPDGAKVYVTLPGKEGYPDWRVAVVNTASRTVSRWVDLRPAGQSRGTRPVGVAVSPVTAISPRPYVVVANEYANFATVVDTGNDTVIGHFATDFYGEDLVFNASGTRLYMPPYTMAPMTAYPTVSSPQSAQAASIATTPKAAPIPVPTRAPLPACRRISLTCWISDFCSVLRSPPTSIVIDDSESSSSLPFTLPPASVVTCTVFSEAASRPAMPDGITGVSLAPV